MLLRKSKILLLDEATSALDNKNERIVANIINRIYKDKTVIMIAHRFETIKDCDKIIVFGKKCKIL